MPGQVVSVLEDLHSAAAAACTAGGVSIDAEAVAAVVEQLTPDDVKAAARSVFPVKFDTVEAEVNFLALYRLLDFGGEYDAQLRAAAGRDSRETIQFGLLGLHLGAKRLDRHFMKDFNAFAVSNYFGFEPRVDEELQPGITISKPGPLAPLAEAIRAVMNEAGAALEGLGRRSLGEHVVALLAARQEAGEAPLAAALVADLAASIPGFADAPSSAGDAPVPFHRKAQALAADLFERFGGQGGGVGGGRGESNARFAFEDAARLSGDSGPLAAGAWAKLGVARLPERLAAACEGGGELAGGEEVPARAAAVAAASAVAAAAGSGGGGGGLTAVQLGKWAASLVDEGGEFHAQVKPFFTPGTVAY